MWMKGLSAVEAPGVDQSADVDPLVGGVLQEGAVVVVVVGEEPGRGRLESCRRRLVYFEWEITNGIY